MRQVAAALCPLKLTVLRGLEGVALPRVAAVKATPEPAHTLGAGAMRIIAAVGVAERVITNGMCRVDGLFQVFVRDGE